MTDEILPEGEKEQDAQNMYDAEYVRKLRKEAKTNRLAAKAAQAKLDDLKSAAEAAEAERLKKQGEFQTLAEQRAARIAELEPYKEQLDTLVLQVKADNLAFVESLPDIKKPLVPVDYEPLKLQQWITKNRKTLVNEPRRVPHTGGGVGGNAVPPTMNDLIEQKRKTGHYAHM